MNSNLYNGLKTLADDIQVNSVSVFKYVGIWNNQLMDMEERKIFDFERPALFFEFLPSTIYSIGAGVQVFDPLVIKMHIIDDFLDAKDGTIELNLQTFGFADLLYKGFQLKQVSGDGYGTSPLDRTGMELPTDFGSEYHHITEFTTTWTDNSAPQPEGGYEIDPPLQADITGEKLPVLETPIITATPTSLSFGNVTVGQSSTLTFTIEGAGLSADLIMSTSFSEYKISLSTAYATRVVMSPDNEEIVLTTVNVKFTPTSTGSKPAHINYGIPGLNYELTLTGTGV